MYYSIAMMCEPSNPAELEDLTVCSRARAGLRSRLVDENILMKSRSSPIVGRSLLIVD